MNHIDVLLDQWHHIDMLLYHLLLYHFLDNRLLYDWCDHINVLLDNIDGLLNWGGGMAYGRRWTRN